MSSDIEIIIGTYEEFLLGYKFDIKNGKPTLTQSFADKSHSGSIRCAAVHERWVASGGTDDRIFIYDMGTRKQSEILLSHEGTINSLAFTPDGTHLLSGGDDGRMIATRIKTWITDATWRKAHNGSPVTHITCHSSGKLALSLGSDLVLRTWNLIKGRVAYKTNLKSRNTLGSRPDCLSWCPSGEYFIISGQSIIEIWSIKTADVVRTQKTKSKPVCITWIANGTCLVGLEDGKILWISIENEQEKEIVAHNSRVKAICAFKQNLVSASSSGEIKLWEIIEHKHKLKEVASTNIGCRPTCLIILDLQQFGSNYVISSTLGVKEKDPETTSPKAPIPQRGIVTIEYDNENELSEKDNNESTDNENDDDSVAESGDDNDESLSGESDDDHSSGEDSNDSNNEPEIRLPKSRKHKIQIVKRQEQNRKKQKIDNKSKQNFVKEQQKKSKLKLKKNK